MVDSTFNFREYTTIRDGMKNWLIANQNVLTDFNDSALSYQTIAAFASQLARLYLDARAGFDLQLVNMAYSVFGFQAKPALPATGFISLSASSAPLTDLVISAGFQVSINGQTYITSADVTMTAGTSTVSNVPIQAVIAGSIGNQSMGATVTLLSSLAPITTGSMQTAIVNGVDQESPSSVLARFRLFIVGLGRSTSSGLVAGALGITDVRSASLDELFPPQNLTYTDPITGLSVTNLVNTILYVETGQGSASATVLAAVQAAIEGTDGNGGMRATGVRVIAQAPTVVFSNIVAVVTRSPQYPQDALLPMIQDAVATYLNNLPIGVGVIYNELISAIMSVPGVEDCSITSPSGNVPATNAQILRLGTMTISFVLGT